MAPVNVLGVPVNTGMPEQVERVTGMPHLVAMVGGTGEYGRRDGYSGKQQNSVRHLAVATTPL